MLPVNSDDDSIEKDVARLQAEYKRRDYDEGYRHLYSLFNPDQLFSLHNRQRAINYLLHQQGYTTIRDWRILEVGCGSGQVLYEFLAFVAQLKQLHGLDLIEKRVQAAKRYLTAAPLVIADGQNLPYPRSTFDIAVQSMAFSSILNDTIRQNVANEMRRVVRPDGLIIWYDFWLNPKNPQTRGIKPAEIRRLFSGCSITFRRVTLAPPIARRVLPVSWLLASLLENLRFLNSHYVALIMEK